VLKVEMRVRIKADTEVYLEWRKKGCKQGMICVREGV
jgi:hypothetical protein